MMRGNNAPSVTEVKLAWAYALLRKSFIEMSAAFARVDPQAAWAMLAAINENITRSLREEDANLAAKGYTQDEMKEIDDRLQETLLVAGQAINERLGVANLASRARKTQGPNSRVA
jgi:hypothetical protein